MRLFVTCNISDAGECRENWPLLLHPASAVHQRRHYGDRVPAKSLHRDGVPESETEGEHRHADQPADPEEVAEIPLEDLQSGIVSLEQRRENQDAEGKCSGSRRVLSLGHLTRWSGTCYVLCLRRTSPLNRFSSRTSKLGSISWVFSVDIFAFTARFMHIIN